MPSLTFLAPVLAALTLTLAGTAQAAPLPAHEWTLPAGQPKGVVVTIHGGGWVGVGAQDLPLERLDVLRYQRQGWTVLNVDYRPGASSIIDVVRFYDLARAQYPGLPICSSGRSAGGHLAMLLAAFRPRLACVISKEGPADLRPLFAGATIASLADVVRAEFGATGATTMSPVIALRGYRGRVLATYSPDDQIIPGSGQLPALRRLPNAELVEVRGTPEKGAGQASWVHIDARPSDLRRVMRAEHRLLRSIT